MAFDDRALLRTHWQTLPGEPVSLDDVIAMRDVSPQDMALLLADLPHVGAVYPMVPIRGGSARALHAEIYVPEGEGPFPVYLYLHGGGYTINSAEIARRPAMRVATWGFVVVNLEYALAPEHPFPAAIEDAVYAARWIQGHIAEFGGDPQRLLIGGDSAGANLTVGAVKVLHGAPDLVDGGDLAGVPVWAKGAVLYYGSYDMRLGLNLPSFPGSTEMWYRAYLGPHFLQFLDHPLVSVARAAHLDKMPATYVCVGDRDPNLAQGLELARALAAAGVPTTASVSTGLGHGFQYENPLVPNAVDELERVARWMKTAAGSEPAS